MTPENHSMGMGIWSPDVAPEQKNWGSWTLLAANVKPNLNSSALHSSQALEGIWASHAIFFFLVDIKWKNLAVNVTHTPNIIARPWASLPPFLKHFLDTVIQIFFCKIMKINNFCSDLTDVSAEKKALIGTYGASVPETLPSWCPYYVFWRNILTLSWKHQALVSEVFVKIKLLYFRILWATKYFFW